jgi:pantoate--beta-alanine ligase
LRLVETRAAFRRALEDARGDRRSIGLVPTMGALHAGHLSLVEAARERGGLVAVSIFVNPLQFGDGGDLGAYPRPLEEDVASCTRAGVDVVFAPSADEMYPAGQAGTTVVPGPAADRLEGASRPGHFSGVATIVTKLLSLANPCAAYFGEKDFQQLVVVRRLVGDLDLASEIVACPTVREADGLAMSSRNGRLDAAARAAAVALWRSLEAGRELVEAGEHRPAVVESAMGNVLGEHERVEVDYAVVADPLNLAPLETIEDEVRLLVAARVGSVRLIDNLAARPPSASNR